MIAYIASAAFAGFLLGAAIVGRADTRPMPCEEDQVYIWRSVPSLAECVNIDDLLGIR